MMWPLIGVGVLTLGFALRMNPLLVVVAAAFASGLAAGHTPLFVLEAFGKAFNEQRYVSLVWLVTPVIGLLERAGLREKARALVRRMGGVRVGRLLLTYFIARQATAAAGLTALGGQAQMVRPLVAPMAEAAAETDAARPLTDAERELVRAHAAAADNIAVFFGEDIFIAFGSVLLIKGVLATGGYDVKPFDISVWAIPTAILALGVHGVRLLRLDRRFRATPR